MAAGNTAAFNLNSLCADDVWDMLEVISKIGISNLTNSLPADLLAEAKFKKPMIYDREKKQIVEMPRDKWTDKQIQAETDAQIAQDKIGIIVVNSVIANIGKCKDAVNRMLARSVGRHPEEMSSMSALEYVNLISAFVSREEFTDFFKQALKSAQTQIKSSTSLSAGMMAS